MKKRCIALLLVFSMVFTLLSPAACENVRAANTVKSSSGNFYYASENYPTKDFKAKYYYMDEYFAKSAFKYQDSLATMSMCLSMAAFRSNRVAKYKDKTQNLEALFKACGFTNFKASSGFTSKPTKTSTGTGIASKKITVNGKNYTLIALAISGENVEAEWSGILRIGKTGNGSNAQKCANNALKFLKQYIKDKKISGNVKLWITGYGVGGGKANLLAGKIDDNPNLGSGIKVKPENIYAYTFQSPKLALTSHGLKLDTYKNIFNICNPYYSFTLLAPEQYKLGRYGTDIFTPTESTDSKYATKRDAMLKKMATMDSSYIYNIDDFQMKRISIFGEGFVADANSDDDLAEFLDKFINSIISSCARTRVDYCNNYEEDIAELLYFVSGKTNENWSDFVAVFLEKLQDNILSLGLQMIFGNEKQLASMYETYTREAIKQSGVKGVTEKEIKSFSSVIARLAVNFAVDYPDETVTFFYSLPQIFAANAPTMNFAWLQSVDDNYNGKKFTNEITANDITKTVSTSKRTIALKAKVKGNAKLTYKSDNSNIAVSSDGKVTIKKNYIGKATITITSSATVKYKKTIKKITVTVKPVKASISSLYYNENKKIIEVKIKENPGNVRYEIQYKIGSNSKFKTSPVSESVKYSKRGYSLIKKISKGKTYYYRVRGRKTVNGKTYYGNWSDVKKIKIK